MTPYQPCTACSYIYGRRTSRLVALVLLAGTAGSLRAETPGGISSGLAYAGIGVVFLLAVAVATLGWLLRQWRGAAAALDRSLSTLSVTFDSIADGVLVVGSDGRVANYNQRFLDLWRIPRELAEKRDDDLILRHVIDQLTSPDAFLDRVRVLYSSPEESTNGDVLLFKDGRVFERDSRPQRKGSEVIGRVWSFRDVTARYRAAEERERLSSQLAQAQKLEAIGTLAGGIAHDFNNILVGIIGYAELARARLPATHPVGDDLSHVLSAANRARELVRQILTFSRKRAPEKEIIALAPIVRDTLKLLRATLPAAIEIRAELEPGVGSVFADPTQLHQALLNLATNGAHAIGGAPGRLIVSLEEMVATPALLEAHFDLADGRWASLSVSDTGRGMDAETLQHVFEPFFTTKNPGEGTGLGLALVQGIIEAHGGIITVESALGNGSTFRIYLPLVSEPVGPPPREEKTPLGNGRHVLVVDDEAMVCEVARTFLEELGYQITICQSPERALEEFTDAPAKFVALLTDLNMPHLNGLELIRRIRAHCPDGALLPCVLFTGYIGSAATEQEAMSLGLREILNKPFTRHSLGIAIHRAISGAPGAVTA